MVAVIIYPYQVVLLPGNRKIIVVEAAIVALSYPTFYQHPHRLVPYHPLIYHLSGAECGQQQHAENVMNDAYPHMLRLSELPASPFDGTSHNININMKRITNGIIGDSDSEVIATGGKARRSSKTSTRSGSMSNDENLCEDDVDDDDLHNSNDDIDEGIFALDEDMPFVCMMMIIMTIVMIKNIMSIAT